jgi:hypothetical protein
MSSLSQLRLDLRKRIFQRLTQWTMDSFDLYEMAELSSEVAMDDIYTVLLNHVLTCSAPMAMDADRLCYVIRKAFAERQSMQV